jgi:hypothetical protein
MHPLPLLVHQRGGLEMAAKDCDLPADATRVHHGRFSMNPICTVSVIAGLMVAAALAPVFAAPPTVVPSPGYDARLQESRKPATAAGSTVVDPATPPASKARRRHSKRRQ